MPEKKCGAIFPKSALADFQPERMPMKRLLAKLYMDWSPAYLLRNWMIDHGIDPDDMFLVFMWPKDSK